jgi:hypothetical protein
MSEIQVANKIKEMVNSSPQKMVEITVDTFFKLWFGGKKFTDKEFTENMLRFAEKYEFGYVTILNNRKQGIAIRIWEKKKEEIKLLEEKDVDDDISCYGESGPSSLQNGYEKEDNIGEKEERS